MEDFFDDEIEESAAFNSQLAGYEGYQRKAYTPDTTQSLRLMNIDISAGCHRKFISEKVKSADGGMKTKEFVLKTPYIQIYACT